MSALAFISHPVSCLSGNIQVPGDKSISHRAVILGAIARGNTSINGFLQGEDCWNTVRAFQSMGVEIEVPSNGPIQIQGVGKYGLRPPKAPIQCGNSGTSMRLLAGLLAAQSFDSELIGDASLSLRPMDRIVRPLVLMGAEITSNQGRAPLVVQGGQQLKGIHYELPIASAQLKTCLLLAGLYAEGETSLVEPLGTRDHTERMLTAFSYPIQKADNCISLDSHSECVGTQITVPGDLSSAAFFIVAATLVPGSEVLLHNVGINPSRMGIIDILKQMGADIQVLNKRLYGEELAADLLVRYAPLEGIDIPSNFVPLCIDEFPILFIAAAAAHGQTRLHGAEELRAKESDRISAMVEGLHALGIEVLAFEDGVHIHGGTLQGGTVNSHKDHRIAMAFAIAGAIATGPVTIQHCSEVATSFPSFVQMANTLQLQILEAYDDLT